MTNHQAFASLAIAERAVTHVPSRSSRRRLAGALATALFAGPVFATEVTPSSPHVAQNWPVQTCDDVTGVGSLRYIAAHAQSGDTIDFSQLPMLCGVRDSTITLTSGEIVLNQANISLVGPLPGDGTVTISGDGVSRVLLHQTYGPIGSALTIENLRIANGYVNDDVSANGGCIDSDTSVYLLQSSVVGCTANSETGSALGGGIHTSNGWAVTTLKRSAVSGNIVRAAGSGSANGAGICSSDIQVKYAQIKDNSAFGNGAHGGGTWSRVLDSAYSTFSNNSADAFGGAAYVRGDPISANLKIRNSTVSGNRASLRGGGIYADVGNFKIYNSTIAVNQVDTGHGGGVSVQANTAEIESMIIASNVSATSPADADLYFINGALSGANNAIMASNVNPAGLIAVGIDPGLAPLGWTGGPTRTHGLLPTSPVIGLGNNILNLCCEQRLGPRTTGAMATVDIGAIQFDRIFVSDFDQFFF